MFWLITALVIRRFFHFNLRKSHLLFYATEKKRQRGHNTSISITTATCPEPPKVVT